MTMKKMLLTGAMASAILTLSSPVLASKHNEPNMPKQHMDEKANCCCPAHHHKWFGFTNKDQQPTIQKIRQKSFQQMKPKLKLLRAKTAMLNALLLQSNVDTKQIGKITKEITEVHGELFSIHVQTLLKIKEQTGVNLPLFEHRRMMDKFLL